MTSGFLPQPQWVFCLLVNSCSVFRINVLSTVHIILAMYNSFHITHIWFAAFRIVIIICQFNLIFLIRDLLHPRIIFIRITSISPIIVLMFLVLSLSTAVTTFTFYWWSYTLVNHFLSHYICPTIFLPYAFHKFDLKSLKGCWLAFATLVPQNLYTHTHTQFESPWASRTRWTKCILSIAPNVLIFLLNISRDQRDLQISGDV